VYNKIKPQYGHAYASTTLGSQKESEWLVYMTVIMDFHSATFHHFQTLWRTPARENPWFQARLLIDYITFRVYGYTTERISGQRLEMGRQNFEREIVTVYPLHYLLRPCCNNHVYYFCVAAKLNTRTSPSLPELGFRYFLEKLPLATGDDDNVQLSKWHQRPT
jgi:hypothetical protein